MPRGALMAEYGTGATTQTRYVTVDGLGSTRLITDASGNVTSRHEYAPFGEELTGTSNGVRSTANGFAGAEPGVRQEFTGKERDAETGLDYFGARYFTGAQGRWSSPDLLNVTDDRLVNPSNTLNKYVYGGNNPLKYVDPDGRDITVFYQTGFPTGHVMMAAVNQQSGDFAFLSVGPDTRHDPDIPLNPNQGVPGTTTFDLDQINTADDLRQNFAALTIQTTPEVAQQAINAIRSGAGSGNWAMLGNNCTTACAKVLTDIGLSVGGKGWLPWTPSRFWANLYQKYANRRFRS